jgi:phage terminase large subunit-like protein
MPARKTLLDHVLDATFDPYKHRERIGIEPLPDEAPGDATRPLLRDRWSRLRELQAQFVEGSERERKVIGHEFRTIISQIAEARREPDTLYDYVSSVIGRHPRSSTGKRRGGGRRYARFCSEFLVHTKGRWAGRPLVLEPWQMRESNAVFAVDVVTGLRLIQEAYIQEPKKNGKSTRASSVAGYLLCADDEPGPEVYGGAKDKDQARIVHGQLAQMLERSRLRPWVRIYKDAIEVPSTGGFYKVIAADAMSDEGVNMSGGVVDELHVHDRPDLYDMLSRSGDAREQPLLYVITNAPPDPDPDASVCSRVRAQGLLVLAGDPEARDDLYASIDELGDDELEDRKAWMRVNKASWITVPVLERARKKSRPTDWLRFRGNRPTADEEESFAPAGAWEACGGMARPADGAAVWVAVDFASRKDTATVVWETERPGWSDGEPGRYLIRGHVWGVKPDDPNHPAPPCHTLLGAGERIAYALVEDYLRELSERFELTAVAYDPWRFARSAELLADEGVVMLEFPQSNERTAPASEQLLDAITSRTIMHDGDTVAAAHIRNAATKSVGRGFRLDKTRTRKAMDYATSLMMAHDLAVKGVGGGRSVYEDRGVVVATIGPRGREST